MRIVVAAPNSAAKPRVGVMSVIFFPIVSMTLQPHVITPIAIPAEPRRTSQRGISAFSISIPVSLERTCQTAAIGPIALERSFAPCANATYAAVMIWSQTKIRSTPRNPLLSCLMSIFLRMRNRQKDAIAPITAASISELIGSQALSANGSQTPFSLAGSQSYLSAIHSFDSAFAKNPFSALNWRARPKTKKVGKARIGANHKERSSGLSESKMSFLMI